jgi:hypothetical protein
MPISDTQKTDYLWKKLGYGVTKTDTGTAKQAFEEAIPSSLLIRGDKVWQQSDQVPATMPSTTGGVVTIYKDGVGSWSATVKCTEDATASDNRTWKTNLTDWISPEFGSTYQVQVYIANDNASNPQTSGTKIFAAGSGNNDEWFFDYQSGILHFIGTNLPTAITAGITGKSIFISGARYTGLLGLGISSTLSSVMGNITISTNTITTNETNQNLVLDPNGSGNTVVTGNLVANDLYGNLRMTGGNTEVIFISSGIANSSNKFTFNSSSNVLTLTGNIETTAIKTDNYYWANGVTVDFQTAAGNAYEIQFRSPSGNDLAASPNLTFDGGNLTVQGNTNLGNLNVTGTITGSFSGTTSAPGSNTQIVFNDAGTSNAVSTFAFDKATNTVSVGSTSGTLSIGGTTITANTDSGSAGLFNLLISNVNIGLSSNVTLGSTSGNVTARGNLIANNISTTGNLAANAFSVGSISGNRANVTVTTDTQIDSFEATNFRSAKYVISAKNTSGYQALEALVIHDGSDSYITVYGAISSTDVDIVTLSSNIVSGNVVVYATREAATTTTVNFLGTYIKD